MFDSPTPASSSSSTLVSAASTSTSTSTSTQSPIHTSGTKAIPKPKLGLNTSLIGSGNNSPKMSDKGFIEPHASHLPRRVKGITNKRERTKTVSVPTSHEAQDLLQQQQQQQVERLRERLQVYQQGMTLESPAIPPDPLPQVSTQPHRDNVPRRNRANTVPNNIRTRRINVPPPIPISIVDSQSTIGADVIANPGQEAEAEEEEEEALSSLYPPPLKLNSKALSLISKAQNEAFKSGPSDLDHQSSSVPTSPQLPHPAMGLTMGIMEAYAAEELEDEVEVGRVHGIVRHGLSYSPALGVKGTPPPPLPSSTVFPVHTTRFVPVPESAPIPGSSVVPKIWVTTPSPVLPPASAPLGQNLPRRHHRCRQKSPGGEKKGKEVLRVERVQVRVGRSKVEANEEEDGLFSPLLDFGRAGSVGETSFSSRGKRKGGEDERCIQVLGRSCVEVGYMPESEKGDYVLIETIGQDEGVGGRLELCLRDDGREGVSSLLPEQVRAGCEFMKGWTGTRMRISVPRWRAQDAFGLAVCFLVWAGEKQVPVACLEPSEVYTPIHLLYMGLLDDGEEEGEEWGKGKGESERVGLGIDFGAEEGSAHSDSTNGSSRSRREPSVTLRTGLRDEWRGVLSYEGLNALAGVWQ